MQNVRRMSKGVFIGFFLAGLIVSFASRLLETEALPLFGRPIGTMVPWPMFLVVGSVGAFFLYGSALAVIIFIYDMWRSIQDRHARTSPGLALALLLIPVFNIYWAFQALWGLAKDYNGYIRRYHVNTPPLPEGLFLTASITFSVSYLPVLFRLIGSLLDWAGLSAGFTAVLGGISIAANLAGWANLVIIPIVMSRGCDASNAIRNVAA